MNRLAFGDDGCKFCGANCENGTAFLGVCNDCYEELKERFISLISEYFTEDEVAWIVDLAESGDDVRDWLVEARDSF